MKLQDIADMKEYLENRCYCPYEIYELNGIFFQCFKPDTECILLVEGEREGWTFSLHGKFVIAKADDYYKDEIIYIEITDNEVDDCIIFDATENNKHQIVSFMNGEIDEMKLDSYDSNLSDVIDTCDCIMVN